MSARARLVALGATLVGVACGGGTAPAPAAAPAPRDTVFAAVAVEQPPRLVSAPPPAYPDSLRRAGLEGDVMIEAVIDSNGHAEPGSIRIVSSPHPDFDGPARAVIERAAFTPGRMEGRAVPTLVRVPVRFRLPNRPQQVLRAGEVDTPARLLGAPVADYPARLRAAGIGGEVVLEMVVDTAGRPEPGSVRVVSTPHPDLVAPARAAVARMVFTPARVGARSVRQLVRVPVRFGARR